MLDSSLVWVIRVYKLSNFTIFKTLLLSNLHPIYPTFIQGMLIKGQYSITFWRSVKYCKNYGTLSFFLTQDHMELEIQNATSVAVFI